MWGNAPVPLHTAARLWFGAARSSEARDAADTNEDAALHGRAVGR